MQWFNITFFHLFADIINQGYKDNSYVKKDLQIYDTVLINQLGFLRRNHTHILRVEKAESVPPKNLTCLADASNEWWADFDRGLCIKLMPHEESAGKQTSQLKRLKLENRGIRKEHFAKYLHYIRGQLGTAASVNEASAKIERCQLKITYIFIIH